MRSGTPGFQAERLVEARDSRGLTQVALADLINRTSSSISRWEAGDQSPEPEALDALARAMNLPVSFFLKEQPSHGPAPMFFRSMASTTLAVRKRSQARLRWAQDISHSLQEWVDFPPMNVPCLDARDHNEIRDEDIELIAAECRSQWGLGTGPIADVVLMMENAGVVVVKEEVGTSTMDGLSNWSEVDNRAYALLARDKETSVRSRMDAAHELGHLVLHRNITARPLKSTVEFKEIERQAFYFASALLMPSDSFASEVWSPSLNTLVALKERWKVSVAGMIMRCSALKLMNDEYAQRLWKHYSARGWRKGEPLDDQLPIEEPRLLARSIKLLLDEGVRSRSDLLSDFRLGERDIESLTGLPSGFMSEARADVIGLPTLKRAAQSVGMAADVIPFQRMNKNSHDG